MGVDLSTLKLNVPMVKRRFRRVLAGSAVDIRTLASKQWTVCKKEVATVPPAIYLGGSIDRITELSPWRDWDSERTLTLGGKITHQASTAHVIKDVDIAGPYLYAGPAKAQPGFGEEHLLIHSEKCQEIEHARLSTSKAGSHFFGTLMLDDMPLSLLLADADDRIAVVSKPYEHEDGYRALLDAPASPLVERARVRALTVYTDFAQNSSKAARYRTLRANLRRHLAGAPAAPGVYLRRGRTGELRVLGNEDAVERYLQRIGFRVVVPEEHSAESIARATLDAPIVVGVEGSHLSHAIFSMADDAVMLVLQPPNRFSLAYKEFTDRMGMRFAFLVGQTCKEGFTVDIDELARLIDQLG